MMPNTFINLRRRLQRGMTFIELIVSIVIVGIAVSGVLLVMSMTTGRSADPMLREQAILIAESYMEEILAQKFWDPNTNTVCPAPEVVGGRSAYDNACDYHNMANNGCTSAAGGACDRRGTTITGLERYNVFATIESSSSLTFGPGGSPVNNTGATRLLRVTVRVTHDDFSDIDIPLTAYRTNYNCGDTGKSTDPGNDTCPP